MFKHNRDITILIVLATVVYMIVHYSSLFQYFFIDLQLPCSSLKILFFNILVC